MKLAVLVVDDEKYMGRLIGRLLRQTAEVIAVTSAVEALEAVESRDFDVILCDIHMPATSGVEFYHQLATTKPGSEGNVVFLTGGLFPEDNPEFFEEIDNPLILKPFGLGELKEAVNAVSSS